MVKNLSAMWGTWVRSLGWEDPLEKGMATYTPVFLPGELHRQRSLVSYSSWGHKESDTTEQLTLSHSTLITIWPTCHRCLLNENHEGGEKGWIRMVGQS